MTTLTVKVKQIQQQALDIKSFLLVGPEGGALPAFTPGSHIDVHVGAGLVRQYSLCNGPGERDGYLIAVKREPESRGGSRGMHALQEGDAIAISAPRNNFALDPSARRHVLLGGGIGITPLLSMAQHLQAGNASFELHYFSRSAAHTAFHSLLSGPELKDRVTLNHGFDPDALRAYLQRLLGQRADGAHLYFCGPQAFMELIASCAAPSWPPDSVHLEYFAADPAALAGPQQEFRIRLAKSGATYAIPAGVPITEVLAAHGCAIETSCEQGVCGTCLTGVLDGVPDHRDVYLTDAEKSAGNKILPCVSRAKTALLVLDL